MVIKELEVLDNSTPIMVEGIEEQEREVMGLLGSKASPEALRDPL